MSVRFVLAALVLSSSIMAQDRVGTSPSFAFLGFPPSVRSAGMGFAGVALINGDAGFYNPALPVLGDYEYSSVTFSPSAAEIYGMGEIQYRSEYASIRLPLGRESRFSAALSHGRVGLKFGPLYEVTYIDPIRDPADPGFYLEDNILTWSASIAWRGPVEVAIGGGYWKLSSETMLQEITGKAGEFGMAVRVPLFRQSQIPADACAARFKANLTAGVSFQNYGPAIDYRYGRSGDEYSTEIPLPKTGRWGVGLDLAYGSACHDWLSILPIFDKEIRHTSTRPPTYQTGVEFGLAEILYLRYGRIDRPNNSSGFTADHTTRGIGLSTKGLRKLIAGGSCSKVANSGLGHYLLHHLNVEFGFARVDMFEEFDDVASFFGKTDYYSLRISL